MMVAELARQLNTDPRNVMLHEKTTRERGVRLSEWIRYLEGLPKVSELAKGFNITPDTAVRWFRQWAREVGEDPDHYALYERVLMYKRHGVRAVVAVKVYKAPKEFVRWARERVELMRRPSITALAKHLRVSEKFVRWEFERWCKEHGYKVDDFLYRHAIRLPPEFVNWITERVVTA